jgi:hypothetical protein
MVKQQAKTSCVTFMLLYTKSVDLITYLQYNFYICDMKRQVLLSVFALKSKIVTLSEPQENAVHISAGQFCCSPVASCCCC